LKIKYIWLNNHKKKTKIISKHVFSALKNYNFWRFWKIHEWIVKKLDVLEKIRDRIRDQRVKIYQKYLVWFKREKKHAILLCSVGDRSWKGSWHSKSNPKLFDFYLLLNPMLKCAFVTLWAYLFLVLVVRLRNWERKMKNCWGSVSIGFSPLLFICLFKIMIISMFSHAVGICPSYSPRSEDIEERKQELFC
jgi:hypothetical protein